MARPQKRKERNRHWFTPYHFIVTFPDRMYPFATQIDGMRVRGYRAYDHRLSLIQKRLGKGRYGLRLSAYRELFHIIGAGLLILTATVISHALWGSDVALPVLFILAMLVITYQEFVLQPRTYEQHTSKGLVDWISWAAPLGLYFFYFLK
jgi:hypothetical protein